MQQARSEEARVDPKPAEPQDPNATAAWEREFIREPSAPGGLRAGQRAAPGTVIGGRYSLRTAIGHGGMGTVWRASDTILRRDVAVKEVLLPPGMAPSDRDSMYQRTLREARAAAALSHPAVVQVYDVVTEAGRPWIIMELLQARSLAEMIVEDGPFAPRAVAKIGIALLGALEVAHAAGVLHRDVKPANVLICGDGRCVLTDFGVARMPTDAELTTPGMVLGSPHFISPERAIGAKFGPPSDLFSLGVTLYTAVEGRPPFDRRDPFETMRAVVEEPPAQAVRAGPLAGVLYGLLEKDPARRWNVETARAVLRDLMVGPLASNAPAHVTDPYAVVRPTPFQPPTAQQTQPTGQVGGRAMMAPGETVSSAIRRLNQTSAPPVAPPDAAATAEAPQLDRTDAGPARPPAYGTEQGFGQPPAYGTEQGFGQPPAYGTEQGFGQPPAYGTEQAFGQPPAYGGDPGAMHPPTYGTDWVQPTPPPVAKRSPVQGLIDTAKRAPRWAQIGVAAGLALVLFLGIAAAAGLFGSDGSHTAKGTQPSAGPATPLIEVQPFHDPRGITINVPKSWTKQPASTFTDFVDPNDKNSKLRVNVEASGNSATKFLEVAENRLKNNLSTCVKPYNRVNLAPTTLAGHQGALLEYTCGSGGTQRHALWGAVVVGGKAYHFFVSVPEVKFDSSKVIYQEMARSFKVTPGQ
jgi:serine/threonine protein kinase